MARKPRRRSAGVTLSAVPPLFRRDGVEGCSAQPGADSAESFGASAASEESRMRINLNPASCIPNPASNLKPGTECPIRDEHVDARLGKLTCPPSRHGARCWRVSRDGRALVCRTIQQLRFLRLQRVAFIAPQCENPTPLFSKPVSSKPKDTRSAWHNGCLSLE